jgi:polyphosphate kinase 2 (PPK2 family)
MTQKAKRAKDKSNQESRDFVVQIQRTPRVSAKRNDKELAKLHVELVRISGMGEIQRPEIGRHFEGRDAAGREGDQANHKTMNPRICKVVARRANRTRKDQWYFQRYAAHLLLPEKLFSSIEAGATAPS